MPDLPGDEVSVTAAPTPVDSTALELAEEMAIAVQEFVVAVERVATVGLGDSAIALLLIHTSQLAAHGARLGAEIGRASCRERV